MSVWLQANWFNFVQSVGIISSLLATVYTLTRDARSRKVSNYISLIEYHRDIWQLTFDKPELNRVHQRDPELFTVPFTPDEKQFLTFVFLHISCSFELQKTNRMIKIEMIEYDIAEFAKGPLVRRFWEENKRYYNDDFVRFVDNSIGTKASWIDENRSRERIPGKIGTSPESV